MLDASADPIATPIAVRPEDVASIDAIVRAVYEAVSFTEGAGPDGPRLGGLCGPHARLSKVHA